MINTYENNRREVPHQEHSVQYELSIGPWKIASSRPD